MMMKVLILFLLLTSLCSCGDCLLDHCDECDWSSLDDSGNPLYCLTCHGWYEASWDTGLCVLSARLIILCIAVGLLVICVTICSVIKIQEYRAKFV
jgi:hypothetical protein